MRVHIAVGLLDNVLQRWQNNYFQVNKEKGKKEFRRKYDLWI